MLHVAHKVAGPINWVNGAVSHNGLSNECRPEADASASNKSARGATPGASLLRSVISCNMFIITAALWASSFYSAAAPSGSLVPVYQCTNCNTPIGTDYGQIHWYPSSEVVSHLFKKKKKHFRPIEKFNKIVLRKNTVTGS